MMVDEKKIWTRLAEIAEECNDYQLMDEYGTRKYTFDGPMFLKLLKEEADKA